MAPLWEDSGGAETIARSGERRVLSGEAPTGWSQGPAELLTQQISRGGGGVCPGKTAPSSPPRAGFGLSGSPGRARAGEVQPQQHRAGRGRGSECPEPALGTLTRTEELAFARGLPELHPGLSPACEWGHRGGQGGGCVCEQLKSFSLGGSV